MFNNPFSFEGRIRRSEFGISLIIYFIAYTIITVMTSSGSRNDDGAALGLIFLIPLLWFLWAQGAKRCHDLGNSGWYQLIPFYALWMLFQDGNYEINEYGANPKGIRPNNEVGNGYNPEDMQEPVIPIDSSGYSGYNGGHNNPDPIQTNHIEENKNGKGYQSGDYRG
jgi:uncharacterized membrane protein YhaH (DUF805 family)